MYCMIMMFLEILSVFGRIEYANGCEPVLGSLGCGSPIA